MAYTTPAELRAAVSPDTGSTDTPPENLTHTAADLSNATLEDAIAEASSTIDAYLASRYVTPVAGGPTPHPIDFWTRNIAAYLATLIYRKGKDFTELDPIVRRYNATMEALTAVRDGKASLPLPEPESGSGQTGAGTALNQYSGQLFDAIDFDLVPDFSQRAVALGGGLWWVRP